VPISNSISVVLRGKVVSDIVRDSIIFVFNVSSMSPYENSIIHKLDSSEFVSIHSGRGTGVAVVGTGVAVGGMGVAVGGMGVAVGGTGVAVGGMGVAVGGTGVAVGGMGVAVGVNVGV
jgi:hypothetical protein